MSTIKVNTVTTRSGCTVTLGESGKTVALASGASQSGFGRTGTVDWDTTPKTASFTAVSGNGYFINTTSSAITITLPSGNAGDIVAFADYANTFDTNNLTITPQSGEKIGGVTGNAIILTEGISATLVYIDATQGWKQVNDATSNIQGQTFITATGGTITTCGDYKVHKFTGPGTFCVSAIGNGNNNEVSYIVVGGGGGGGWDRGGGGGAGGFRESKSAVDCYSASPLEGATNITVTATGFPITVGAGGAGGTDTQPGRGCSGSNSTFSSVTSTGGGAGGSAPCSQNPGLNGGSGGGVSAPSTTAGTGNTPPVNPSQGNPGGTSPASANHGSGGGGATAVGANGTGSTGGNGGAGATTSIVGSSTAYAGGGGGGGSNAAPAPRAGGTGGSGGGGDGGDHPGGQGSAGSANTGGGGGAGANDPNTSPASNGAAGGSGIIIIRYKFQ